MGTQPSRQRAQSRRAARKLAAEREAKRRRLFMMLGAVGAAILIALALILVPRLTGGDNTAAEVKIAEGPPASIPTNGRVLGDPNAPVKIVEWGDYQ